MSIVRLICVKLKTFSNWPVSRSSPSWETNNKLIIKPFFFMEREVPYLWSHAPQLGPHSVRLNPVQMDWPYVWKTQFVNVLPSTPRSPNLYLSFTSSILYAFLISSTPAICPDLLILLIISFDLTAFLKQLILWSSYMCTNADRVKDYTFTRNIQILFSPTPT